MRERHYHAARIDAVRAAAREREGGATRWRIDAENARNDDDDGDADVDERERAQDARENADGTSGTIRAHILAQPRAQCGLRERAGVRRWRGVLSTFRRTPSWESGAA